MAGTLIAMKSTNGKVNDGMISQAVKDEIDDFDFLMNESFERKQRGKKKNNQDEAMLAVGEDLSTIMGST
jgi:hypothetical protein